jgi:hypothetical protein
MANLVSEQELFFTAFEPKVQNRYIMQIDGIPSYLIKKIDRPKLTQEVKKIDHINLQRYIKGKSVWEELTIELYDPIVPSGAQAVMEWVRLHHESVTGRDGYAEFYKKDIIINVLGPVGDKVEEWILKGTQITSVEFGEMKWETDDLVGISLKLRPDFCILNY